MRGGNMEEDSFKLPLLKDPLKSFRVPLIGLNIPHMKASGQSVEKFYPYFCVFVKWFYQWYCGGFFESTFDKSPYLGLP